jgi:hypothetical protein
MCLCMPVWLMLLRAADICPNNQDSNTEAVADGACRCKAGYYRETGFGPNLVCKGATVL